MKQFEIVYADPPWPHWGDPNKMAAAGKHYSLMTMEEIDALPISSLMVPGKSWLFLWATCPRLDLAVHAIRAWNLEFRGVAFVWVKTRKDGTPMGARGVRPSHVKPTTELLLAASHRKTGRPLPILTEAMRQTVFAPVGRHSEKPEVFREKIVELLGDRSRVELFARNQTQGWETWGNEVASTIEFAS